MSLTPKSAVASQPLAASWKRWLLVSVAAIVVAHLLDPFAWQWRMATVYEKDWGRLLRIMGFLPTWGLLALAWWLQQEEPVSRRHGALLLVLGPAAGGIVAELLKLLVRRLRPADDTFGYVFRSFAEGPFSNRGMGMPSSHTLVAFAGAFALARLFPRAQWVFYALAAGCAITRILSHAHYLSDTVVAACLAWIVVTLIDRWLTPPAQAEAI
ncbi:MAG TPA: phosphatase PAP2 family protein [Gemmatimonas sp.]|uniref:phosphatase PAP2 family protein n=1 Tax=Gemmatimonas sp. TaxID=1962908 RepID=UPI002ED9291B